MFAERGTMVHVEERHFEGSLALWIYRPVGYSTMQQHNGLLSFAQPVTFVDEEVPGKLKPEPTAVVDRAAGQMLIDELWRAGLRPSAGLSSTGEAEARREHVADLRNVVNALLEERRPR